MTALYLLFGLVLLAVALLLGVAPVYPLQSRKNRIAQMTNGSVSVEFQGDTHSNTTLDGIDVGAHVVPGAIVTGAGIPAATTIVSYDFAAHTAVLSAAATATAANVDLTQDNPLNGGLGGNNFRLGGEAYAPNVGTLLADVVAKEIAFTGYAAVELAMSLGYVDPGQQAIAQSQLLTFAPTADAPGAAAHFWWVDNGTDVLAAGQFAAPVALTDATKELSVVLQDSFPTGAGLIQIVP